MMQSQTSTKGFKFVDFVPEMDLKSRAKEKLARVFGEAPSDSSTEATMSMDRGSFIGRLHVRSAVGHFVAEVKGADPLKIIDQVTRKVRSQLRLWKRERALTSPTV